MSHLTLDSLRILVAAGAVHGATLRADGGVFYIDVVTPNGEQRLTKTRSKTARAFGDPTKALLLLQDLGVTRAQVETSDWRWEEKPIGKPRPDRSAAMRSNQQAIEHDRWFRSQVERSVAELEAGVAELESHEEAERHWQDWRAALKENAEA